MLAGGLAVVEDEEAACFFGAEEPLLCVEGVGAGAVIVAFCFLLALDHSLKLSSLGPFFVAVVVVVLVSAVAVVIVVVEEPL